MSCRCLTWSQFSVYFRPFCVSCDSHEKVRVSTQLTVPKSVLSSLVHVPVRACVTSRQDCGPSDGRWSPSLTNSGRTQPEVFSGCDEENCFVVAQTHFWPRHPLSTAKADDCSRVDDLTCFPSSSIGSSKSLYSCQTCSPLVRCSADPSSPRQRSNFIWVHSNSQWRSLWIEPWGLPQTLAIARQQVLGEHHERRWNNNDAKTNEVTLRRPAVIIVFVPPSWNLEHV